MPNRNLKGDYRYGYQGEFAETDPETGKPAFELRLYDPRINRWLSPDPYGEYASPYLAMGNNWISNVDPDGGCVKCDPNAAVGSTATDAGGYAVTMTADGWVRDDGYGVDLGTVYTENYWNNYWSDINASAEILNNLQTLNTGKTAEIRVLEAQEQYLNTPRFISLEIDIQPIGSYPPMMDLIAGGPGLIVKATKSRKLIDNPLTKKVLGKLDDAITKLSKKASKSKHSKPKMGNNRAVNQQVTSLVKKYNLNREKQRQLHDYITGQNYSRAEIEEIIKTGEYLF